MAEPNLRIPKEFVEPAATLARLDDETFEALVGCLASPGPAVVDRYELPSTMADCTDLSYDDCDGIIQMAVSLMSVAVQVTDGDMAAIAQVVSRADELPGDTDRDIVAGRLTTLLRSDAVELLRSAMDLLAEHDHVLSKARIVTDLRPIFPKSTTAQMRAVVVGHSLRFQLIGAEPRTIEIALDAFDLRALQTVIQRAVDKEESLSNFVVDNGLPLVRPFGPEADNEGTDDG